MSIETITTKEPGTDRTLTVDYNFGDTLADAVAAFGEDVVMSGFKADARVGLQAKIRGMLKATEEDSEAPKYDDDAVIAAIADWKPGIKTRTSADPMAKLLAMLEKLDPAQRAALLSKA